jgi:hypothetical protein
MTTKDDLEMEVLANGVAERRVRAELRIASGGPPDDGDDDGADGRGQLQPDGLPKIVLGVDEARVNDEAISALAAESALFQRANLLVHVLRDDRGSAGKTVFRPAGAPRIVSLPTPRLREMMARRAAWLLPRRGAKGELVLSPVHPPEWAVRGVAARGNWSGLRHLDAVVGSPTLRPDGTVLDQPGYDEATGLLYEPRAAFSPVPVNPTTDEVRAAVTQLLDPLRDFPFEGDAHRAAWLAALLTVLARFAFSGPAPLFLFTANTPGSGKTLLASIVAEIVEGREISRTPYPVRDEEMSKVITSVALAGDRLVLFDNVDAATPVGTASLDAALTATAWKARVLGASELTPDLPLFVTWFLSGNNLALRGDIHRRVIPCRLQTTDERPESREGFFYADLLGHVRQHRPDLVVAALTVLRGFFAAGRPNPGLPPLGSYEGWSAVVRGAVNWAYGHDPAATREGVTEADESISSLAAVLEGWSQLPGGTDDGLTVAEALRILNGDGHGTFQLLRDTLASWSKREGLPGPQAVGYRLRAWRGRVIGGRVLVGENDRNGVRKWRVKSVQK